MKLVTIKESSSLSDILVLKSKLESEGIECYVQDELSSQVLNYLPYMSAKLQVEEKDLEAVRQIMTETGEWEETN